MVGDNKLEIRQWRQFCIYNSWGYRVDFEELQNTGQTAIGLGWTNLCIVPRGDDVELRGDRRETPEELASRVARGKQRELEERAEYERLARKFGGPIR